MSQIKTLLEHSIQKKIFKKSRCDNVQDVMIRGAAVLMQQYSTGDGEEIFEGIT